MKKYTIKALLTSVLFASQAIAAQEFDIAAYYWPAYHPDPRWQELGIFKDGKAEWQNVYEATPKFIGHDQPKIPVMGYDDESSVEGMTWRINTASEYGVNVFIFDWYWYGGKPFLEAAVNRFVDLKTDKMKFFIMWANHDVVDIWDNKVPYKHTDKAIWPAALDLPEFKKISDRMVSQYFTQPNYYKIDGKPVFSIYELGTFIKGIGGVENAKAGLQYMNDVAKKAGLPGVHIQTMCWNMPKGLQGVPGDATPTSAKIVDFVGVDSFTSYQWIHYRSANGEDYKDWGDWNVRKWDSLQSEFKKQNFYAHVSIGWDNNPRYPASRMTPMVMRTGPALFEGFLQKAKDWTLKHYPNGPKLITINSWNEWTEGSYLEPDMHYGYAYLEAIRRVFLRDANTSKR